MTAEKRDEIIDLTDEDIEKLENVPEVVEAVRHLQEIQFQYRSAALDVGIDFEEAKLPDLKEVINQYRPKLKRQRDVVRELVAKHL